LTAAQTLVEEQLQMEYIEVTHSPQKPPIFVIKKKYGKWHLLQDLRVVNKVLQPLDTLKPGLLSPTAIHLQNYLYIIDLKDCFFTIPLHPEGREKFTFSLPCINHQAPYKDTIGKSCHKVWPIVPLCTKNLLL
jgi:hypothetical protein